MNGLQQFVGEVFWDQALQNQANWTLLEQNTEREVCEEKWY